MKSLSPKNKQKSQVTQVSLPRSKPIKLNAETQIERDVHHQAIQTTLNDKSKSSSVSHIIHKNSALYSVDIDESILIKTNVATQFEADVHNQARETTLHKESKSSSVSQSIPNHSSPNSVDIDKSISKDNDSDNSEDLLSPSCPSRKAAKKMLRRRQKIC